MDPSGNTRTTTLNPLAGLPQLPHGVTMDNTYGAMLLGTFFSLILYGVLLHQIYSYLRAHSADSHWIKFYVALIFSLDTAHTVVIMSLCYSKLISHYFNISSLASMDWPLSVITIVISTNIVACQCFFAYRVYQIGRKSRTVVWFCMICQGVGFGLCIAFTVKAFQAAMWEVLSDKYASWISIALGFTVFIDTALAGVLVFVLHRSRTGLKSTNSLLDTLIAYAVTTGLLTELNFRRPREPAWAHCTGMLTDAKTDHISLPDMSRSGGTLPQAKVSHLPTGSSFSDTVIDIKIDQEASQSTGSEGPAVPRDLELGEEGRASQGSGSTKVERVSSQYHRSLVQPSIYS
ncbi:hypothetical protein GSI_05557 [Ganoderma sinense ZZ0214-1]|uniref:DUF6534 domain-containing protein n=1 Tax=Ganoderma sinense ZZ0214-1 TaxID=1077348 RepID=A0A2G8SEY6_9APHY|nr:hypothetical protein GSI_05557 [Ganoderma sinense ZZ0214-1]